MQKLILPLSPKEIKKSTDSQIMVIAKRLVPLKKGKPQNTNPNSGKKFGPGIKYYHYELKEV